VIKKAKYIKISLQEYQKYLSSKWHGKFDQIIVILGIVNVVATIPQLLDIWTNKSGAGVSIITWTYYVVFTAILLIYSFKIKSKPMIIMYSGNTLIYTLVLFSAIIYR